MPGLIKGVDEAERCRKIVQAFVQTQKENQLAVKQPVVTQQSVEESKTGTGAAAAEEAKAGDKPVAQKIEVISVDSPDKSKPADTAKPADKVEDAAQKEDVAMLQEDATEV